MKFRTLTLVFAIALLPAALLRAQQNSDVNKLAHDIYKQLIETNTTESIGNMTTSANEMATRLRAAGFPASDVVVLGQDARHGNIVARIHGTSEGSQSARKPILFLAHLDVVEANRADWSIDPFKLTEKDGFFYGRGQSRRAKKRCTRYRKLPHLAWRHPRRNGEDTRQSSGRFHR